MTFKRVMFGYYLSDNDINTYLILLQPLLFQKMAMFRPAADHDCLILWDSQKMRRWRSPIKALKYKLGFKSIELYFSYTDI